MTDTESDFDFYPEDLEGLQVIFQQCWDASEAKRWHEPGLHDGIERKTSATERLFLVVSELVEAMEELRNGHSFQEIYYGEGGKPEGFPVEIADAIIRLGDLVTEHKVPVLEAMAIKQRYNQTRPIRHGGKTI